MSDLTPPRRNTWTLLRSAVLASLAIWFMILLLCGLFASGLYAIDTLFVSHASPDPVDLAFNYNPSAELRLPRTMRNEFRAIRADYEAINNWLEGCRRTYPPPLPAPPLPAPPSPLPAPPLPPAASSDPASASSSFDPKPGASPLPEVAYYSADYDILQMNARLGASRASLIDEVTRDRAELRWFTWIAIAIGFVSTVLVGLGTREVGSSGRPVARWLRDGALASSALATALAGLAAFHNPREELIKARTALSAIRLLHQQVAIEAPILPCGGPAPPPEGPIMTHLSDWNRRYTDISVTMEDADRGKDGPGSEQPSRNARPAQQTPGNQGAEQQALGTQNATSAPSSAKAAEAHPSAQASAARRPVKKR